MPSGARAAREKRRPIDKHDACRRLAPRRRRWQQIEMNVTIQVGRAPVAFDRYDGRTLAAENPPAVSASGTS